MVIITQKIIRAQARKRAETFGERGDFLSFFRFSPLYNIPSMKRNFGGIKTYQIVLLIALALFGILVGSFYDLSLAEKFFYPGNLFGKALDAVGSLPGYALLGASGILLYFFFKNSGPKWRDYLAYGFLVGLPIIAGALWGYDVLGDFVSKILYAVGLGIAIVAVLDSAFYFFAKGCDRVEGYKDAVAILFSAFVVIVLVYVLKKSVVRPRYLFLADNGIGYFQPWYVFSSSIASIFSGDEYSALLNSWPSGHAAMAGFGVLFVLLAKLNKKTAGKETIFFFASLFWIIFVALARMSDGHHFLSDVSWGVLIGSGFSFLTIVLVYGARPELDKAIAANVKFDSLTKGRRRWKWDEWLLHKTQNRESLTFDSREYLAIRRANNAEQRTSTSSRPSFKLSKTKKSAKDDPNSDDRKINQ